MTETVKIDELGIRNTISSDWGLLGPHANIDAFATSSNASPESKYPEGLPAEFSATDLPMGSSDAQRRTATGITRTTDEVDHDAISKHAKSAKKNRKTTVNTISTILNAMLAKAHVRNMS